MKIARAMLNDGKIDYVQIKNEKTILLGSLEEVQVQAYMPPVDPRAIFCIGLNYRKHAIETGAPIPQYPVVFMKNPASVIPVGADIVLPEVCDSEVDYEGELAVVIEKDCKNATMENALDFVLGYTIANDVSARIWQKQKGGSQWVRGKSFDTFCPLGPAIVTKDEIEDPNNLSITTYLNDEKVQESNTSDMIFSVRQLICFLSQDTTLLPGTVILTGTPSGVGWAREPKRPLKSGDVVRIQIEKIGELKNPVQ